MKKTLLYLLPFFIFTIVNAQKKVLDHSSYDSWRSIEHREISRDGNWIGYSTKPVGYGDPLLYLTDSKGNQSLLQERGTKPRITFNSIYAVFTIQPAQEMVKELKRKKTPDNKLPKDSLAIYELKSNQLVKIPNVKNNKVPEKWGGWIAYQLDPVIEKNDTTSNEDKHPQEEVQKETTEELPKQAKKENKENGYTLILRRLDNARQDTFRYVTDYQFAKEGKSLAFISTGIDSTFLPGVYAYDIENESLSSVFNKKGKYSQLSWDEKGKQLAFVADLDTTKALVRPYTLYYWKDGMYTGSIVAGGKDKVLPDSWVVSHDQDVLFSKDGTKLFFGSSPEPIVKDTTLLPEEIVNVEVWNYTDQRLHTHQKVQKEDDLKKAYTAMVEVESKMEIRQLGNLEIPVIITGDEGNAPVALGRSNLSYQQFLSWEGFPEYNDLYIIDVSDGTALKFGDKIRGSASLSPKAQYVYWYSRPDSAWFTYSISKKAISQVTNNERVSFYNELNDSPNFPSPYGVMSWTENDERILIYDRFDIWEVDPENNTTMVNITGDGRTSQKTYRYVKLDDEERFIKENQDLLITAFNNNDKSEEVMTIKYGNGKKRSLFAGDYHFSNFKKAQESEDFIYTQENFQVFPDIVASTRSGNNQQKISDINPQQIEYNWGTAELYNWTSLDGKALEGLLIKPENFDPSGKYPMIVNFYERSADGLNRHRAPFPHRSTINYSFYASRGYVIFNPNVEYRIGYPGESAYNCVIPGVTSLINQGFIDKERIGTQGHSWGGYQVAYLVTKTDLFKCAESGAPVANMISAYGGIRWGSGLSRMFQYEHTQSRIGGTLWEYPIRYIENSPIFFADKINTPVLIMHNDEDGAVPWYQGIEFFVALRRLGKPAWMLNYQGEPHWPLKLQNRLDFVKRMQQFFDHYLLDQAIPVWMKEGVPAMEVGIKQGFEAVESSY